ncbi:MAG: tetratricopeptide repeat protein, partial [Verrucomicrobiota bacterium]
KSPLLSLTWGIVVFSFLHPLSAQTSTNSVSAIAVLSPSDPIMDRGLMFMTAQQYESAIIEFSNVAQNYPSDLRREESLFQIAECYRLLNRNTDALNAYLYLEKSNPKTLYLPQIQIQVGLLYGKLEKFKEAIPYLKKAQENPPKELRPLLQYALGLALLHNQQSADAIPLLKSCVETSSTVQSLAAWALADHFEKVGESNEAFNYWKKALDLTNDPELKAQATARSGWTLLQQNKNSEARALFEKTRLFEKEGDWRKIANTGLLQIAYQNQKYDEVVKLFKDERQSFLDGRRADIFFMVGFSHYQLKNMEQAVEV